MSSQRNAPCPCGSGRKYKHCCMPKDELLELDARIQEAVDLGEEDAALELARQMFARGMAMIGNPAVRQVLMESVEGYVSLLHRAGETETAVRGDDATRWRRYGGRTAGTGTSCRDAGALSRPLGTPAVWGVHLEAHSGGRVTALNIIW